jgi:nucleotide-binding universal stress UspA family protein
VDVLFRGLCARGEAVLARVRQWAAGHGIAVDTALVHAKGRPVASAILDHAAESGAEMLVLATRGREGLARLVAGSHAEQVLRRAHVPVLLVRCPEGMAAEAARPALHACRPPVQIAA